MGTADVSIIGHMKAGPQHSYKSTIIDLLCFVMFCCQTLASAQVLDKVSKKLSETMAKKKDHEALVKALQEKVTEEVARLTDSE